MTDPQALAAAFAYYRSRGLIHGDEAARHAATILAWAAEVWGWACEAQTELDRALDEAAAADGRVDNVRAAVQHALDDTDPDRPAALAGFLHTVAELLDITPQPTARPRALGAMRPPSPTPRGGSA